MHDMQTGSHDEIIVNFQGIDCIIRKSQYTNGRPALLLFNAQTHAPIAHATVNVPGVPLHPGEVLIKDWGENKGILHALEENYIVMRSGNAYSNGNVTVHVCEMLRDDEIKSLVQERKPEQVHFRRPPERGFEM